VLIAIVTEIAAPVAAMNISGEAMKSSTVDLVVTGDERAAVNAAVNALRHGPRVLVVLRGGRNPRVLSRLRRACRAAHAENSQLTVMTNAEVVCADGVDGVEAVVVRYVRTGHLFAVNASAFLSCDGS
jgi:hypothetical protein